MSRTSKPFLNNHVSSGKPLQNLIYGTFFFSIACPSHFLQDRLTTGLRRCRSNMILPSGLDVKVMPGCLRPCPPAPIACAHSSFRTLPPSCSEPPQSCSMLNFRPPPLCPQVNSHSEGMLPLALDVKVVLQP